METKKGTGTSRESWLRFKQTDKNQLPHPSTFDCRYCNHTAEQYHDRGYRPECDRDDVVPTCTICHRAIHKNEPTIDGLESRISDMLFGLRDTRDKAKGLFLLLANSGPIDEGQKEESNTDIDWFNKYIDEINKHIDKTAALFC